jgi:hypothetical protein
LYHVRFPGRTVVGAIAFVVGVVMVADANRILPAQTNVLAFG